MNGDPPERVQAVLTSLLDSFEKLEIVFALHGAPGHTLSVDALCRILKFPRETARQAVTELRVRSVVSLTSRGEVQLEPPTSEKRAAVHDLIRQYGDDRLVLVKALGDLAVVRVRQRASHTLPQAFVLRSQAGDDDVDS